VVADRSYSPQVFPFVAADNKEKSDELDRGPAHPRPHVGRMSSRKGASLMRGAVVASDARGAATM
jgi:hypothetical protein